MSLRAGGQGGAGGRWRPGGLGGHGGGLEGNWRCEIAQSSSHWSPGLPPSLIYPVAGALQGARGLGRGRGRGGGQVSIASVLRVLWQSLPASGRPYLASLLTYGPGVLSRTSSGFIDVSSKVQMIHLGLMLIWVKILVPAC